MPAMRRKDRSGPGIKNCEAVEDVASSGEGTTAGTDCSAGEGISPLAASRLQLKRESESKTDRQKGDFTAGFLAEPARPHFTWNLSRKAGVSSIRETEMFPDLGLLRAGPCSEFNVGKIPHIAQLSKLFFGVLSQGT